MAEAGERIASATGGLQPPARRSPGVDWAIPQAGGPAMNRRSLARALSFGLALAAAVACRSAAPVAPPRAPAPRPSLPRRPRPPPRDRRRRSAGRGTPPSTARSFSRSTAPPPPTWSGRPPPGRPGPGRSILDADETVHRQLALPARARAGRASPSTRRAGAPGPPGARRCRCPGPPAFLSRVRALGGRIAIVTNRTVSECPDTEAVFRAHGLPYDVMLCKPDGGPSDKSPRFEAVARGTTPAGLPPLEVVAFVGDNIQDFPGQSQAMQDAARRGLRRLRCAVLRPAEPDVRQLGEELAGVFPGPGRGRADGHPDS